MSMPSRIRWCRWEYRNGQNFDHLFGVFRAVSWTSRVNTRSSFLVFVLLQYNSIWIPTVSPSIERRQNDEPSCEAFSGGGAYLCQRLLGGIRVGNGISISWCKRPLLNFSSELLGHLKLVRNPPSSPFIGNQLTQQWTTGALISSVTLTYLKTKVLEGCVTVNTCREMYVVDYAHSVLHCKSRNFSFSAWCDSIKAVYSPMSFVSSDPLSVSSVSQ